MRLKAIRLQAEDGAWEDRSRHRWWYDTELGTYCAFETAADEVLRCVPRQGPPWANLFADAVCSQRVAFGPPCAIPQYVAVSLQDKCAGPEAIYPSAVFALGSGFVPDVLYGEWTDAAGNVTCTGNPNSEGRQVFPLLSEVPPARFVAATVERVSGSRIQASEIAAADGARGRDFSPAFDSSLGTLCELALAADGEWRCLPRETAFLHAAAYADATCTQPLVAKPEPACDAAFTPAYAGIEEQRVCTIVQSEPIFWQPPKIHVHELGPPSTLADVYRKASDGSAMCEGVPDVMAGQYARLGAERPSAEFARAGVKEASCGTLGASGSRLKAYQRVFDDGSVFARPSYEAWIDTDTGQACSFNVAADNVVRCLPTRQHFLAGREESYGDAGCTQVLHFISRCSDDPLGPPKFAIADEVGGECTSLGFVEVRHRVFTLGAPVTPSALYVYDKSQVPARCIPIEQLDPPVIGKLADILAAYDLLPLGSEVPPSAFVAGSLSTP
jgi:hypothetical protein